MNIVLLSGGSGTRLWPLSNDVRSKQFLKILKKEDGSRESMAQRMLRMIREVDPEARVVIATSQNQIPQIRAQLGDDIGVSIEPDRKDTFPAIALAAAYLKKQGVQKDEAVVVCPVDPYVNIDYFYGIKELETHIGKTKLVLMGVEPSYPSEKYGYIIPASKDRVSKVKEFKEKPNAVTAEKYIAQGALWNCGVFGFKLSYVLGIAEELLGTSDYDLMFQEYGSYNKISFDYEVVENESSINVLRFKGDWKDLGTWNTLSEAMSDPISGNAVVDNCNNTHVINELGIPLVALGVQNSVIAATPDGILVCEKTLSDKLKSYVSTSRPMYERRQWGEYKVLNYNTHKDGNNSLVKELIITPGKHISYQKHYRRTEMWTFTEGQGLLVIDGITTQIGRGDSVVIPPETLHAIKAVTELHVIEVQLGDELTEDDIDRFDWNWE